MSVSPGILLSASLQYKSIPLCFCVFLVKRPRPYALRNKARRAGLRTAQAAPPAEKKNSAHHHPVYGVSSHIVRTRHTSLCLLFFHNSDRIDDLVLIRPVVPPVRGNGGDLVDDFDSLYYLAERRVLAIQIGRVCMHDKELAACFFHSLTDQV